MTFWENPNTRIEPFHLKLAARGSMSQSLVSDTGPNPRMLSLCAAPQPLSPH